MKTKPTLLLVLRSLGVAGACALTTVRLAADILTADTAVFVQTDPKSTILARLKSGTTVTVVGEAPAGWRRIEVSGPFEAYVHNRDMTKGLDVREGANIYAAPKKDAPVLTVAARGDKAEITGIHGEFSQVKLEKTLQGFIAVGETANTSVDPKPVFIPAAGPAPVPPAPVQVNTPGRPVQLSGNTAEMPRMFAGRLVLARRALFNPNPPYDYQLSDASGRRFAYVDTKRLRLNEKIETLLDLNIAITGTVRNTVDGKDLVIAAESMQLK